MGLHKGMNKLSLLWLLAALSSLHAADPIELKLWPDGAPGKMAPHSQATEDFIRTKAGKSTITDIHEPTITVYRPEKPNGTSVIVAPGGGFVFLSAVHEGTQVCEWLNSIGVTGILLKYRTPTRDEAAPHEKPVQDAVKAISLVRTNAKEWQLDPRRVGLLGFSAGGNLLAYVACAQDLNVPSETKGPFGEPVRPNFGIMIYGGGWLDPKDPTKLKEGFTVSFNSTPLFIACAHDDGQNPIAATALYLEYKKQNLPAELHLFTKGGHGFGMRKAGNPINAWPQCCAEWMESMGWLPSPSKIDAQIKQKKDELGAIKPGPMICTDEVGQVRAMIVESKKLLADAQTSGDRARIEGIQQKLRGLDEGLKAAEDRRAMASTQGKLFIEVVDALKSLEQQRSMLFPHAQKQTAP